MSDTNKKNEDQQFNKTLKRMLETPPKPHKKNGDDRSRRPTVSEQNFKNGSNAK